eukprot:g11155.t1
MSGTWCTIESDPGVFTELIESIGVEGVQMEELYSLDESNFSRLRPVYGLVFLFKWTAEVDKRPIAEAESEPGLFFARQVIPNACATQAILSVLLNCADKIDLGETLDDFMTFTREFPPELKGLAISNSEKIRSVHNMFSRQEPFFSEDKENDGKKEDAFHFVAYVPHDGKVFELDGLKSGPIILGEIPPAPGANQGDLADSCGNRGDDWLSVVSPAIEERIARYSSGEIRFNLMAIVKNRKQVAMEAKERCMRRLQALDQELSLVGADQNPEGRRELETQRAAELRSVAEFDVTVSNEDAKFAQWRKENVRRKHDYVPFAVNLFEALAKTAGFQDLLKSATTKAHHRAEDNANSRKRC